MNKSIPSKVIGLGILTITQKSLERIQHGCMNNGGANLAIFQICSFAYDTRTHLNRALQPVCPNWPAPPREQKGFLMKNLNFRNPSSLVIYRHIFHLN